MLAAYGSGASKMSYDEGKRILNLDIGGGTTKLAIVVKGDVVATAALLRQQPGDGLGILAPQGLTRENDHPGVDVPGLYARRRIGLVDDDAERGVVDTLVAGIGRQRNRRLEQGLP